MSHAEQAVRRGRLVVLAGAVLITAIKLCYAATTFGSNDIEHFMDFASYVHTYGPIGIYGAWHDALPYNHPPLIGWMLAGMNFVSHSGMRLEFLVRLPAILADVVSALLVFEVLRARRPLREAVAGGLIVAATPVLIIISGFHGNTDPAFVMLAMLSFYLLLKGRSATAAGLCLAIALSIKLVPIVVAPLLLVMALRSGWRRLGAFVVGAGAVFALLWVPVIVKQWAPFSKNVLGYAGTGDRRWGIPEFIQAAGGSADLQSIVQGPGRFVAVALSAAIPALIAWRRPQHSTIAFGLSFSTFLLLSTASATQYLAWAAAPSVLVAVYLGGLYNLTAGVLLIDVYDDWNSAPPWNWHRGHALLMNPRQTLEAAVVWVVLLCVVAMGMWYSWRSGPAPAAPAEPAPTGDATVAATPDAALTSTATERN
jgi:hypothetical protein